ncbi:MobC family plasmid mobilization relaxosome protein [Christensenellaceae bacterium OttesenSCG-928-M15]|nr:MobC family plasmid mobilization relaxosome protein [Christensenellaceae bacterium OttesenSCG-928-M15]
MRKRDYHFHLFLNDTEKKLLFRGAEKSGLSKSVYLRSLITGHVPKAQPSADFFTLYRELNAIGNSLNQIAAKANAVGFINAAEYNRAAKEVRDMTIKIYQAVTQPEQLE